MINLLPDKEKSAIQDARVNIALTKTIIIMSFSIIILAIFCASTYVSLNNTKKTAEDKVKISETSQDSQVDNIGLTIANTQSILRRQINYSDVIMSLGQSLPSGVTIDRLILTENSINSPISVDLQSNSTQIIPVLIDQLQKSPLFSDVLVNKPIPNTEKSGFLIPCTMKINKGISL